MNAPKLPLMAHFVAGYPSLAESLAVGRAYGQAGVRYIEAQIPFSHPTADGSLITEANRLAAPTLTLADALHHLGQLQAQFPEQRVVVMTYLNKIVNTGVNEFLNGMHRAGLTALIVPDLPFDSPLAAPVWADDKVSLFPVIGHNIAPDRLRDLCRRAPTFVYVMSGYKLTGSAFGLAEELPQLIEALRGDAGASVGIGFGIATPEDATAVLKVADCAIIGSAFLRAANEDRLVSLLDDFRAELTPQFTPPA